MAEAHSTDRLLETLLDMPDVDASAWTRVGGTAAGGYYLTEPGVIVAVPVPGYIQREADAQRSLEEFHRIVAEAGKPHAAIILVDRVRSQDASARRVWSGADDRGKRSGLALVCASPLARAIGSFFIGFNRPSVPTKMFAEFRQALEWSRGQVREDWERGDASR
jgi:hypothetical protein